MSIDAVPAALTDLSAGGRNVPTHFDVNDLLWPYSVEEFMSSYLEQQPLHIQGREAQYYQSVFALEDVDHAVAAAPESLVEGAYAAFGIRSIDGERQHYYFDDQGPRGRSNTAPHRAFDEGYTIVANTLNRHNAAVARLSMSIEAALQSPVTCNLYLTPPGAQGFGAHADSHDTYLAQIEGRKRWALWEPDLDLPMTGSITPSERPQRLPDRVLELEAGDLLYIPHGWWHYGETSSDDLSLHVTFGTEVIRWTDVVIEAVKAYTDRDIRMRRRLPVLGPPVAFGPHADDLWDSAAELARDAVAAMADPELGRSVIRGLLANRLGTEPPLFEARLRATMNRGDVVRTSLVEQRAGLRAIVDDVPGGCKLEFVGGFVNGPVEARAAFEFAAENRQFSASELPGLPDDFQLQLVQELVLQGMVRVVTL